MPQTLYTPSVHQVCLYLTADPRIFHGQFMRKTRVPRKPVFLPWLRQARALRLKDPSFPPCFWCLRWWRYRSRESLLLIWRLSRTWGEEFSGSAWGSGLLDGPFEHGCRISWLRRMRRSRWSLLRIRRSLVCLLRDDILHSLVSTHSPSSFTQFIQPNEGWALTMLQSTHHSPCHLDTHN